MNKFIFKTGEPHCLINARKDSFIGTYKQIDFEFTGSDSIIYLLLEADALKREGFIIDIIMPYVPFSRQDRVMTTGEPFSLKVFADLINSIGANRVIITDPHSDVTPALINNCHVIHQHEVFKDFFEGKKDFYLISPDGGALKKIYKLASIVKAEVIECSKKRNVETGEITGTVVHAEDLNGKDCYIVDDICDGGRTFIEIAKILKQKNAGKIILMVSHGFFTNGLAVFDNLIDEIYTRKGKLK